VRPPLAPLADEDASAVESALARLTEAAEQPVAAVGARRS